MKNTLFYVIAAFFIGGMSTYIYIEQNQETRLNEFLYVNSVFDFAYSPDKFQSTCEDFTADDTYGTVKFVAPTKKWAACHFVDYDAQITIQIEKCAPDKDALFSSSGNCISSIDQDYKAEPL